MTLKKEKKPTLAELIPNEAHRKKIVDGLYSGQRLLGTDGIFTDMIQAIVNAALEGELASHLTKETTGSAANRRNGKTKKQLRTESGTIEISTPRDRNGSYEPTIVAPWQRQLNTGMNDIIISLYARGQSVSDIQYQLQQIYGVEMSTGAISLITDQVWNTILDWQQRDLQGCYPVIYLDGIYFTVRENGQFIKKVFYSVYGVDVDGNRDILGLYLRRSEGANDWGLILEDLKKRGVEEVFFFCIDGLPGLSSAIKEVYPTAFTQRCVVHMVRQSVRFVSDKDRKAVCSDLRKIYTASDREQAAIALEAFAEKWGKKYPNIAPKWEENWDDLMEFMSFGKDIRRMIYTTNPVEALHRVIRKVTKTKGAWTNDKALLKQIYLALTHNEKSWKRKAHAWKSIQLELANKFGERFLKYLN